MSYQSDVLALSGLVAFWPLNETSGTTAADLGPHNLPLTYSSGKTSGPNLCSGLGASLPGNGSSISATETSSPTGTALEVTTGFTVGGWFQINAATATFLVNAGSWRIGLTASGGIQTFLNNSGGTAVAQGSITEPAQSLTTVDTLSTGTPYFVAVSWDGGDLTIWIDGLRASTVRLYNCTINATSAIQILTNGSSFANASAQGVFVLNRGITAGECLTLFKAGTLSALQTEAFSFDFQGDAVGSYISGAATGRACDGCGGAMRVNEARITSGVFVYHPWCTAARMDYLPPHNVIAGTTPAQYAGEVAKLMWNYIVWSTRRTAPNDQLYLTTSNLPNVAAGVLSATTGSYAGFATACAILARFSGASANSWLVNCCKAIHNGVIAQQITTPGTTTTGSYLDDPFYAVELSQSILILGPLLDSTTRSKWVTSLLLFMNSFYLDNYYPFYANGNYEAQYLLAIWCTGQITGDSKWTTQYTNEYNWMINPSSIATPTANNSGIGRGLCIETLGTATDGSDSSGFLAEDNSTWTVTGISKANPTVITVAAGGAPSSAWGMGIDPLSSTANRASFSGTPIAAINAGQTGTHNGQAYNGGWTPTPVSTLSFSIPYNNAAGTATSGGSMYNPGFDPDYTSFQSEVLTRLWILQGGTNGGDPNILRLMNMMHNQCAAHVTTWGVNSAVYNATNGTRHSLTETYTSSVMQTLQWIYGRTLNAAQVASQFNGTYQSYNGNFTASGAATWRGTSYELGGFLMCAPSWPGLP